MDIQFSGFRDRDGVRQFAFDCIAADHSRSRVTVLADTSLARKYAIPLQELPLLCRRLLDSPSEAQDGGPVTLSERDMAAFRAAADAGTEKRRRKVPVTANTGRAWRHPQL